MHKLPSPLTEIVLGTVMLFLLGIAFNPFAMVMSDTSSVMIALALVVLFGFFSLFALREHPRDEREELLLVKSNRFAFLATGALLVVAVAYQVVRHEVDTWLIAVFAVMIFAKLLSYAYVSRNL